MKAAVLINLSKEGFLVCTRRNSEKFCFVGGKIESGETPIEAVIRETNEETGLIITKNDVTLIDIVNINGYESYIYFSNLENIKPYENEKGIIPLFKQKEELVSNLAEFKNFNIYFLENFKEITTWYKKNKEECIYNHFADRELNLNKPNPLNLEFKLQKDWKNYVWIKKDAYLIFNNVID